MLKESCSNCGLVQDIKVTSIIHSPDDERIMEVMLKARFSCDRCNIDRTSSIKLIRTVHDLSAVRDPELLRSTLEAIEIASPGSELMRKRDDILAENCPLFAGLRNFLSTLN